MSSSPLVTTPNLGTEFEVGTNEPDRITLRLGAGLNKNLAGEIVVTLATTTQDIVVGHASGLVDGTTVIQSRFCTIVNTGVGQYTATFLNAHPDGNAYEVVFGVEEDIDRDVPKPSVVEGSKTANSFDFRTTVDDNGGAADAFNTEPVSFEVLRTLTVITGVTAV